MGTRDLKIYIIYLHEKIQTNYYSKTKSFVTSPKAGPQSELTEKHLILPGSRIGNTIQPFD